MTAIAYSSPLVPPEWIAAHGLRPCWLRLDAGRPGGLRGVGRGLCPLAGATIDYATSGPEAAALVLTTTCDQLRYAAAVIERFARVPVFLLNVPSTWQTEAAQQMYRDELRRLGRFLVHCGGAAPSQERLAQAVARYEEARRQVRQLRPQLSARQLAEALVEIRSDGVLPVAGAEEGRVNECGKKSSRHAPRAVRRSSDAVRPDIQGVPSAADGTRNVPATLADGTRSVPATFVPLALVGGPVAARDFGLFDLIERCGARLVLDASETGERTLPAAMDPQRIAENPFEEMAAAYFGQCPDVFRRPNDPLYDWLGRELSARGVRGIIFRRYVGCDLWHAELFRLRQWSPVPVLDIDVDGEEDGALGRTLGRLEAFVETLQ